jgi:protein MpaA
VIVGRSVEGRPLEAARLGESAIVFGAIHGDEPASAELCLRAVERRLPATVLPIVNPDGLLRCTKNNAHDVDLNRNFPARSFTREHAPGYDPGPSPLSEPEAAALAALVDEVRPRVVIAVHQPFGCVNWDGPAEARAALIGAITGWPLWASIGYPTPGSFGACYGVDRGLAVITLELPRTVEEDDYARCLRALECAILFPA